MKIITWQTKHLTGLLIALGLILGTFAMVGVACSCAPNPEPLVALDQADAVFAGRIVGLALKPDEDPAIGVSFETLEVTVAVHSVWKGDTGEDIVIYTAYTCCVCGYAFQLGEEYLIYAFAEDDGTLRTSICSRTMLLSAASEDLAALGDLKPQSLGNEPGDGGLISP